MAYIYIVIFIRQTETSVVGNVKENFSRICPRCSHTIYMVPSWLAESLPTRYFKSFEICSDFCGLLVGLIWNLLKNNRLPHDINIELPQCVTSWNIIKKLAKFNDLFQEDWSP